VPLSISARVIEMERGAQKLLKKSAFTEETKLNLEVV
jgi:hypothetical protein